MSSITWKGSHLSQHVGKFDEELGHIAFDPNSKTYVLWLKDTCGILGLNGGYIRGDEFPSGASAKEKAVSSASAFILHHIWMRNVVKQETIQALDDHWDDISSELPNDANKDDLRDRVGRYIEQLPIAKIKIWAEKIRDSVIVSAILELAKRLLGG